MNNLNIFLFVFSLVLVFLIFFANLFLSRFKWIYKYYFGSPIGVMMILYFLICRWVPDIQRLMNTNMSVISQYEYSIYGSKVLLLDMCPLSYVLLSLSLVFDKSRVSAKVIAPITIIGSTITIFGILLDPPSEIYTLSVVEFIFIGSDLNKMYFMMHFISLLVGIGVYLNVKTYTKYSLLGEFLFLIGFIVYLLIVVNALSINANASGMVAGDGYPPLNLAPGEQGFSQYHFVYQMGPLPFPVIVFFGYFIILICILIMMYLKNRFSRCEVKIAQLQDYWHQKYKCLQCLQLDIVDAKFREGALKLPSGLKARHMNFFL